MTDNATERESDFTTVLELASQVRAEAKRQHDTLSFYEAGPGQCDSFPKGFTWVREKQPPYSSVWLQKMTQPGPED